MTNDSLFAGARSLDRDHSAARRVLLEPFSGKRLAGRALSQGFLEVHVRGRFVVLDDYGLRKA